MTDKSTTLAHYLALANDAELLGPNLGHPNDPRNDDDPFVEALECYIADAINDLTRAQTMLTNGNTKEATYIVRGVARDLGEVV